MSYEHIIYKAEERIARITLNRPEKKNALSWPLLDELSKALKDAERDPEVSVIILSGAGSCFSSGHDLSETMGDAPLHKGQHSWYDAYSDKTNYAGVSVWDSRAHVQGHIEYLLEIWNNWKPVIAQVHGYCLGGAAGIALACDMLIASEDARLGYPPVRAMAPGDEIAIFAWHMGIKKAKELSITGDSLTANEMREYGVANYIVPREELEETVTKIAKRIAHIDIDLLALSKRVVNRTFDVMGFGVSLQYGGEFDTLGHMLRPRPFSKVREARGLKEALEWRDGPFGGIMGRFPEPK